MAMAVYIAVALFQSVASVGALTIQGDLPSGRSFSAFLGKFCFDYNPDSSEEDPVGLLRLEVSTKSGALLPPADSEARMWLFIFDDEGAHWQSARDNFADASCDSLRALSSAEYPIEISGLSSWVKDVTIHEHIRPRFWYATAVNCGYDWGGEQLQYKMHAVNPKWGWQAEFSLDHSGLPWLYLASLFGFGSGAVATVYLASPTPGTIERSFMGHPYVQLLLFSFLASAASCFLQLVHYMFFMWDGLGASRLRVLGILAGTVAESSLYLVAVLASCGWAVNRDVLPKGLLGAVVWVGCIHAYASTRSQATVDQSTKMYAFQGEMGELSLMFKLFIFCWAVYQAKSSYESELCKHRRRFYKVLFVIITLWTLSVPVTSLLAVVLAPWVRYKVVTCVDVSARMAGQYLLLAVLLGPWSPVTEDNMRSLKKLAVGDSIGANGEAIQLADGM